jgi:hypothetical protein
MRPTAWASPRHLNRRRDGLTPNTHNAAKKSRVLPRGNAVLDAPRRKSRHRAAERGNE